ncbi:hypothetical protein VSS37_07040 [Candidatus Thiothrix sp. Deng01]|uniref:Tetratricopeptide repeat protein n=1 Tax=Candidatus Thiothrix phosphatis TaxID=3112415 RepID=A0ABU6CVC9_9GAMM|nr:hypothetical protein [Candidatus Thiothrix sp. Deng01]MEB4590729.1 hypothetical protein [Candidatus Thiothrix sp. Deng01]
MDLQDFEAEDLYFNAAIDPEVAGLLEEAASLYPEPEAETLLMRAYFLAPEDLNVLVALYRYFYYQHRLPDALRVAQKAITVSGKRLNLPEDWRHLTRLHLGQGVLVSMTLTRFYLMAHKGAGYLEMRLGELPDAVGRLQTLVDIDSNDRLSVKSLLEIAKERLQEQRYAEMGNVVSMRSVMA